MRRVHFHEIMGVPGPLVWHRMYSNLCWVATIAQDRMTSQNRSPFILSQRELDNEGVDTSHSIVCKKIRTDRTIWICRDAKIVGRERVKVQTIHWDRGTSCPYCMGNMGSVWVPRR